jgi:choline dehydrogenase-like flavoprotein
MARCFVIVDFRQLNASVAHDVCIVGAGPVGLALALSCAARGLRVLVLESGLNQPSEFHVNLGRGTIREPAFHTPLNEANCRALGGTSYWWGGRCIPFDSVDFTPGFGAWPIDHDAVGRWYPDAAAFFGCGSSEFSIPGPWPRLTGLRFDQLERWCPDPNMARAHLERLEQAPNLTIVVGATVTDLRLSPDRRAVRALTIVGTEREQVLPTPVVVLACGGVQTPRLLLSVQRREPDLFGGTDGPLGRFYMGHIFGKIADLVLEDPGYGRSFDFFMDHGAYVRRRFTFPGELLHREQLPNISFAAGNARLSDPTHRNGVLSLLWLVLASPMGKHLLSEALLRLYVGDGSRPYAAHLANIARSLLPTISAGISIYRDKYVKRPGKPSIFLFSSAGRYSMHYHSEQRPRAENRISLSDERDAFGLPRVDISFRYSREDAEQVVKAHEVFDNAVRRNGIGRVVFQHSREELISNVLAQACDGMHQIGAARMSEDPSAGVVDAHCRVHGLDNLYLASSCIFPSAGTANPTFLSVALALRLADHLATRGTASGPQNPG